MKKQVTGTDVALGVGLFLLVLVIFAGVVFVPALILWWGWLMLAEPFGAPGLSFWQVFAGWLCASVIMEMIRRLLRSVFGKECKDA